jgi:hypothetical protein
MATTNSSLQTAWTPEDYGKLIDTVIAEKSRVPCRYEDHHLV